MQIVNRLASLGLHRRLPYLSRLYARIDAARADAEENLAVATGQKRFVLKTYKELTLLLDRTSPVDDCIIRDKGWEGEQIEKLFSYIEAFRDFGGKRYFIDAGAYWGLYSLMAHQTHWFNDIFAFEPDPLNRCQLYAQLAVNLLHNNIDVRAFALSDRIGSETFLKSECHPTGNRAGTGLYSGCDPSNLVSVRTDKLDNQLQIEDALIFIKIDVEGHELNLLAGANTLLTKNKIVLQVECFQQRRSLLRRFLEKLGYSEVGEIGPDLYFTNCPKVYRK